MIQNCVLWCDEYIIVLNKLLGLLLQGGSGQGDWYVDGLIEVLMFGYKDKFKLVYCLDKDILGVLLLVCIDWIVCVLFEVFCYCLICKIYWVVVVGVLYLCMGLIKYGLVKVLGCGCMGEGEKMVVVLFKDVVMIEGVKCVYIDYVVLLGLGGCVFWVVMVLVIGCMYQLCVYMFEMGYFIVGDGKYGGLGQENFGDGWGV